MSNITSSYQYWIEVEALATQIAQDAMSQCDNSREEAEELITDSLMHETIGAHQWVIYNAYNLDILQYSDNQYHYVDEFGADDAVIVLRESGLGGLHQALAFWALYADTQEKISEALDEVESNIEE